MWDAGADPIMRNNYLPLSAHCVCVCGGGGGGGGGGGVHNLLDHEPL